MLIGMSYLFPMQRGKKHCKLQCILHVRALRPRKISYAYYIYICNDQLLLHYTAKFGKEHMQKQRKNNKQHTGGLRNHNFGKTKNTWEETTTKTKINKQKHGKKQRTFQKSWGWGRVTTSLNFYFVFQSLFMFFFKFEIPTLVFQVYWFFQIWARKASGRLLFFVFFSPILLAAKFGVFFRFSGPRIRRNGG